MDGGIIGIGLQCNVHINNVRCWIDDNVAWFRAMYTRVHLLLSFTNTIYERTYYGVDIGAVILYHFFSSHAFCCFYFPILCVLFSFLFHFVVCPFCFYFEVGLPSI